MAATALDDTLRTIGVGNAAIAAEVGVHRTQIWAIRTGRKVPRADTAEAILAALRKHGVELTLAELLAPAKQKRRRSS